MSYPSRLTEIYIHSIDVGFAVIDGQGTICLVNDTVAGLLDKDKDTMEGLGYSALLPEDAEGKARLEQLVLGEQDKLPITKVWWNAPESFIYIKGYAQYEAIEKYGRCRLLFLRDVSEEVLYRERLDFQASILQNMQDSVIVTDREGRITYWNEAATALFGPSARDMLRQHITKLNVALDLGQFLEKAQKSPDYTEKREWVYLRDHAEVIYADTKLSPLIRNGEVSGLIAVSKDFTESKKQEQQLQRSQQELSSIVNSQTNYLIRTDLEGYFTYANPAFLERFSYYGEIIGMFSMDTIIPEDHDKTYRMIEACLANPGKMEPIEIRKPAPNGGYYTNYWEFIAITDDQGIPTEIQGVGYDISEKIKRQHEIDRKQQELSSIVNSQTNYLIRTDLEGNYSYANPAFLKKFSHYGDIIGKLYFPTIHPDDVEKTQKMAEECLSEPGKMVPIEIRKPAPNGGYYTNYWEFVAITDDQGNPTEIQGVGYDISQKKRSEEQVKNLNQVNKLLLEVSAEFINVNYQELQLQVPGLLESMTKYTGFERAFIYLFNQDQALGYLSYAYHLPEAPPFGPEEQVLSAESFPWWMERMLSGETIQIHKLEDLPAEARNEHEVLKAVGVRSAVVVPIIYQGDFLGYAGFSILSKEKSWDDNIIELLQLLGAILANALYRVRTERKLIESNQQYRMLADNITDMVSRHNTQLRTLFVSPSCYEMLGYQPRDLLGRDMKELLHPTDREHVQEALEQSKKSGKGSFQARMRQHDGAYKWVESYVSTVQITDSLELILVTRNIDEQKQVEFEKDHLLQETQALNEELNANEEELRQNLEYTQELNDRLAISERHFKGLIEKSFDAIVVYDRDGVIKYASPPATKITGYTSLIGMQGNSFVVEEDLVEASHIIEQVMMIPGEHISFEQRIRRADGAIIWIEAVMTNQLEDEAIQGLISNFRDITERKAAGLALEESRTSLNIAQRLSKVGSWEVGLASGKSQWSEEFYHIFALNPGESGPENTDIFQMIHHEDREMVRKKTDQAFRELKEIPISYRIIDAKGRLKFIEAQNKVIRDAAGRAVKMLGTMRDVTLQTKLEQLLDETSRIAKVGGWEFDVDANRLTWTSEIYRIHEVPLGEATPIERAFGFYHPDDVSSVREAFGQLIGEGKSREMEVRVITARGNLKWVRVNGEPHDIKDGKVIRVRGSLQDITERKKREEKLKDFSMRLQLATASAQIGVWDLDIESGQLIWDQRTCEQHGLSMEEFDGSFESWQNRVHPDDIAAVRQKFNTSLEKQVDFEAEFRIIRADNGKVSCIQAYATIVKNMSSGHLSMIGVSWDITERKENEQRLLQKNEDLEKVNAELDHFVYSTSHNLRAPLTSILGIVQVLSEVKTEEERQMFLGLIGKSIHKLDETIQEISDYSKNTRLALKKEAIYFTELINGVRESLSFMEHAGRIDYILDIPEDLVFNSDSNRLRIIFNNLLSNATKYLDTKSEHSFIKIDISQHQQGIHLIVEDNGIGIKQEHLDRIFDMFFRATNQASGSGLGLYIVKEAVSKLGGDISIASTPGVGTRFDIYLPGLQ